MEFSSECRSGDVKPVLNEILDTIAESEGVDPAELSPPLNDVIDPDALQQLISSARNQLYVTFSYRQWVIEVRGGDEIQVVIVSDDQ